MLSEKDENALGFKEKNLSNIILKVTLLKWLLFFYQTLQYFVSLQTQNQKDAYEIGR